MSAPAFQLSEACEAAGRALQALESDPATADWRTHWSRASETFWDCLSEGEARHEHVATFVRLLGDTDRFALARLVIPALRSVDVAVTATHQQRFIVDSTQRMRGEVVQLKDKRQADFDDAWYDLEKRIQRDSDMHRARVFLHDLAAFGCTTAEDEIREWLKNAPQRVDAGKGSSKVDED